VASSTSSSISKGLQFFLDDFVLVASYIVVWVCFKSSTYSLTQRVPILTDSSKLCKWCRYIITIQNKKESTMMWLATVASCFFSGSPLAFLKLTWLLSSYSNNFSFGLPAQKAAVTKWCYCPPKGANLQARRSSTSKYLLSSSFQLFW